MSDHARDPAGQGPPASPLVRSLFDAARTELPDADRLARIASRLPMDAAPGPASGRRRRLPTRAMVWAAAACVIAGIGASIALRSRTPAPVVTISNPATDWQPAIAAPPADEPSAAPLPQASAGDPPRAEPPVVKRPVMRAPAPRPPAPPPVPEATADADAGVPSPSPSARPSEPAAAPTQAPAPARSAAVETEGDLLDRAAIILDRNPSEALRLAERHRAGFPDSALASAREVLAIQALLQLGRTDEARARGERFLRQYPRSQHRSLVERMIRRPIF